MDNALKAIRSNFAKKLCKGIIGNIPIVGTFSTALVDTISEYNLCLLFQEIEHKLSLVYSSDKKDILISDITQSTAFNGMLRHAVLKTIQCYNENQVKNISTIIVETMQGSIPENIAIEFNNVLFELSEIEAVFFTVLYKHFQEETIKKYGYEYISKVLKEDEDMKIFRNQQDLEGLCVFLCKRLDGKGLIKENTGAFFGNQGDSFHITSFGISLIKALKQL